MGYVGIVGSALSLRTDREMVNKLQSLNPRS